MPNADLVGELRGRLPLARGETRTDSGHGDGFVSAGKLGSLGDDGAIHAPGIGDRDATIALQNREQLIAFLDKRGGEFAHTATIPLQRRAIHTLFRDDGANAHGRPSVGLGFPFE